MQIILCIFFASVGLGNIKEYGLLFPQKSKCFTGKRGEWGGLQLKWRRRRKRNKPKKCLPNKQQRKPLTQSTILLLSIEQRGKKPFAFPRKTSVYNWRYKNENGRRKYHRVMSVPLNFLLHFEEERLGGVCEGSFVGVNYCSKKCNSPRLFPNSEKKENILFWPSTPGKQTRFGVDTRDPLTHPQKLYWPRPTPSLFPNDLIRGEGGKEGGGFFLRFLPLFFRPLPPFGKQCRRRRRRRRAKADSGIFARQESGVAFNVRNSPRNIHKIYMYPIPSFPKKEQ